MCLLCNYGGNNIHNSQGLNYIGSNSLSKIVSEGRDAASNSATSYSISSGDIFSGIFNSLGDRDFVAITLTEGFSYQFDLTAQSSLLDKTCKVKVLYFQILVQAHSEQSQNWNQIQFR